MNINHMTKDQRFNMNIYKVELLTLPLKTFLAFVCILQKFNGCCPTTKCDREMEMCVDKRYSWIKC